MLAPRPQTLKGLVVGLLDNTKPNGAVILRAVGRELKEKYGVREIRMFAKGLLRHARRGIGRPADAAQLRLRGRRDR